MSHESIQSDELQARIFEAEALIDRRRYAQARRVLAKALQMAPEDPACLYLAAFVDYAEDDHDAAMTGIAAVLRVAPGHYGARRLRASLLEQAGELAGAEIEWIALLREYPEDPDCYGAYAELMLRALEADKARRLAAEGLRHDPSHEGCLYVLALLDVIQERGVRSAESGAALRRLLEEHPERARAALALVTTLSDRGDQRMALRVAQELLRSQPDSPHLVELVRELRRVTHWSMKPLYPLQKWGWGGSIAMYVGAVTVLTLGQRLPPALSLTLTFLWLGYVVYSWVWPSILQRLLD